MNCANHPETAAEAYCQYCGKPLCTECIRKVNDIVSCEPCLAARIHPSGAPIESAGFQTQPWGREPWIAAILGFIPGVGAMYNGQIAKGLGHVVIFAILVDLSHFNGALGVLIAAWIFYQVFDAYQTAAARRDGLPLPNPLGLNDIGRWFGVRSHEPHPGTQHWPGSSANPNPPTSVPVNPSVASSGFGEPPHAPGFTAPYAPPPPVPPVPPPYDGHDLWRCGNHRGIPTGAIALVILGVVFLLSNLGILSLHWITNGWPILLIALGIWLLVRQRPTPPAGGAQ